MLRADMQIVTSGKRGAVAAAEAGFAFPQAPDGTVASQRHPLQSQIRCGFPGTTRRRCAFWSHGAGGGIYH
jgi:hypothetical protein